MSLSVSFLAAYNESIENLKIDLGKISNPRILYLRNFTNSWKLDFSESGYWSCPCQTGPLSQLSFRV